MTYYGRLHNGTIIPESDLGLPDGSRVRIEPIASAGVTPALLDPFDTLGNDAVDAPCLPVDLAAEHDHYIYGTPKRNQRDPASGG